MATVLVVEDDAAIRSSLLRALAGEAYAVVAAGTGMAGLSAAVDEAPDIVLLDLGLPDVDGLQVLSMLRAVSAVPVIVATARDDERSIIAALDGGADDYLVKPYGIDQLLARIRAVLRRVGGPDGPSPVTVGELVVNPGSRAATLRGEPIDLSRKEFDLLYLLAQRAGEVVSKREIPR